MAGKAGKMILHHNHQLTYEDVFVIEKAAKTLRNMHNISAQVLNGMINECHPLFTMYLKNYIIAHNKQTQVIWALAKTVEEMWHEILKEEIDE